MHLQRSAKEVRTLTASACHFLFNVSLGSAVVVLLSYGFYRDDHTSMIWAASLLGLWFLSTAVFFARRLVLRCALCSVPLWSGQKCQKHKKAKPALGVSYRLGVASGVVFKGRYRCPYCGEPFSARKSRRR